MNQKDLDYFNRLLTSQLYELQNRNDFKEIQCMDQNNAYQDPLDNASSDTHKNMQLKIKERKGRLILKIKEALERISDGTYGICENCEEEIPVKRLEVRPVTTLCIGCKTREEAFERVRDYKKAYGPKYVSHHTRSLPV
jgi:RNA polymerase-binding transcription factor